MNLLLEYADSFDLDLEHEKEGDERINGVRDTISISRSIFMRRYVRIVGARSRNDRQKG